MIWYDKKKFDGGGEFFFILMLYDNKVEKVNCHTNSKMISVSKAEAGVFHGDVWNGWE